jgi:hypothetical protein
VVGLDFSDVERWAKSGLLRTWAEVATGIEVQVKAIDLMPGPL